MYQQILVPLDGSALAETVLRHVTPLAKQFGSRVTLLRVVAPMSRRAAEAVIVGEGLAFAPDSVVEVERKEAEAYLTQVAARLASPDYQVERRIVQGEPAGCIVREASELKVDLIAMTTHGKSGLASAIFGSAAAKIIREAPCPVLLIRSSGREQP